MYKTSTVAFGPDWLLELDGLALAGVDGEYAMVVLVVEDDRLDVVEYGEQMGLDGVAVARLAEYLEQRRIGDEEEARKERTLLLQVARQRLLAQLELLEQVGEQLTQCVVVRAAHEHVRLLARLRHYAAKSQKQINRTGENLC